MYTQRNVPKYNTCLNKQFSLLTFMFKYIFTNLIVRTILQSLSNIILYITNALVVTKTTFGIHTSFSTTEKSFSFQFSRWQVPLLARSKVSSVCSQFAVSSNFNFLSLRLPSYLNSWSSKEAAIASEGSSLSKPSLPVRKYVGTAPNPYQKKASKLNISILRG